MTKVGIWSLWRENAAIDMKVDVCPSNGNKEYSFCLCLQQHCKVVLQGMNSVQFCKFPLGFPVEQVVLQAFYYWWMHHFCHFEKIICMFGFMKGFTYPGYCS
jgi:hypothetical protein